MPARPTAAAKPDPARSERLHARPTVQWGRGHQWRHPRAIPRRSGCARSHEFDAANETWPRGDRPAAIRAAAAEFRERFATPENRVSAVRTVDIASAPYPLKFAFGGAAKGPNPYINIVNRLQVVQFEDFEGRPRTLAYEPTVTAGPQEAPFYEQMMRMPLPDSVADFLAYKVIAKVWNEPDQALARAGLRPEDVDFISFDHLHVQDVRFVLGTTEPIAGEAAPRPPLFPNAKLITQRREWDTFASIHPMQWAWYVGDGIKDVPTENVVLIDGDVELGKGCALISTPGHTDGNHSLCINTPDGVWVSSENGVAADSWHPEHLEDPGRAAHRGLLRPRGDPELEHARGLDRPVRLDDQGEGARRPEPSRPALPQRLPVLGDAELEAPVAGAAGVRLRRHQLRRDRAPLDRRRSAQPIGASRANGAAASRGYPRWWTAAPGHCC